MFNKPTRSYLFRELIARRHGKPVTWRDARLMFKGATVAAIVHYKRLNG